MSSSTSSPLARRRATGGILLLLALTVLIDRYTALEAHLVAPLVLGLAFLAWALLAREPALLVPGGILSGLGAGVLARRAVSGGAVLDDALFLLCFGAGWGLITLLNRTSFNRQVWWPLIPGGIMALLGVLQLAGPTFRGVWRSAGNLWPFVVLGVALWLLLSGPRRRV